MSAPYTDESKRPWSKPGEANPTIEEMNLGCLQRIASAVELSCKDREKLERDYRYMRDRLDEAQRTVGRLARSNAAPPEVKS